MSSNESDGAIERTGTCPVCGERHFRIDYRTDGFSQHDISDPVCVEGIDENGGVVLYIHD